MRSGDDREGPQSPGRAPTLRRLAGDADHRIASFGPILISVWIKETRIEALQAMETFLEGLVPEAPGGRPGLLVVVSSDATAPSSEARSELARMRRTGILGWRALVHEGTGFGAALVRGVTTSLNLLERGEPKTQIFATVASAAGWIALAAPEYGGGGALEAAVRTLREPLSG